MLDWRSLLDRPARVVFLGETNHFVHEKVDFRLEWLKELSARRPLVIGEELGWCDARRVADYILRRDDTALDRIATFGYEGYRRPDRDDTPKGIFGKSPYPYGLMRAEHQRFYEGLRELPGIVGYFGFDIDAPGGAYEDLPAIEGLARVPGETLINEADRLEALLPQFDDALAQEDLRSLIESLRYTDLVQYAETYEATRPAMAYREETMKRRVEWQLANLPEGALLVLMAHAFHLARRDAHIGKLGVGPGGDRVPSLGEHMARKEDDEVISIWMLYGEGEDAQPLADLPRRADYPTNTINRQLLARFSEPTVLTLDDRIRRQLADVPVGHMYNQVIPVDLGAEADAVMFFPHVAPLRNE